MAELRLKQAPELEGFRSPKWTQMKAELSLLHILVFIFWVCIGCTGLTAFCQVIFYLLAEFVTLAMYDDLVR